MTRYVDEIERERHDSAIGVWDNEGGASARAPGDEQYGRRIEADRSWTIYHVFTGVPANREGQEMIGLSRSVATDGMLSLDQRNDVRRKEARERTLASAAASCNSRGRSTMTLEFRNPSRSFDEGRNAIRFIGHDGMFEVPFFVEVEALARSSAGLRSTELSEEMYLLTFDSARRLIEDVAREAYSHRRQTSYTLIAADFR